MASLSSLVGAHMAHFWWQSFLPPVPKMLPTLVLPLLCSCPSFEWCLPQKGSFWCSRCNKQHPIFKQEKPSLRALKSKYTLLCFNRKFIRAAYVHDSCLGKFVESKTHKVANRLRKIKWNKRPMKRKSTTYITSWVLPGDTTDVHLLFTIWHCKIFWVVLTGRLLSSNKAGESACLWRVVCFQEWLMSSLCCSSSFSSNHSICSLKKTRIQVEHIADSALLSTVRPFVRVSQAWHLSHI